MKLLLAKHHYICMRYWAKTLLKAHRNNTYIATDRWIPVHIPRAALPVVVSPWLLQTRWLTLLEIAGQEPGDNPALLAICTREDRVEST